MSKQPLSFKLVAYTDAAGKYDAQAYRCGNEDNFYVDDNLADNLISHCNPDQLTNLSELGMLMVVADGMGGMNAGEVASQIAIDTVKSYFSPNKITKELASTHTNRANYLEATIKAADRNIKDDAQNNPEHQGMGSTIILAWLWNNELTISWCGDSRAYIFNQKTGIQLISEDHSYVQELVNKGVLTYEQTFDHPQNNIVTRSLGDPHKEAHPESRCYYVAKGDVILLCSDGLSGVLRDKKTYDSKGNLLCEDNLEDILRVNDTSMKECREALWRAAERADWYDNVTAILCKITVGEERTQAFIPSAKTSILQRRIRLSYVLLMIPLVIVLTLAISLLVGRGKIFPISDTEQPTLCADSLTTDSCKKVEEPVKQEINSTEQGTVQPKAKTNDVKEKETEKINHSEKPVKEEDENKKLTPVKDSKKDSSAAHKVTSETEKRGQLTKVKPAKGKTIQQPATNKPETTPKK